jgi:hypothetical protein
MDRARRFASAVFGIMVLSSSVTMAFPGLFAGKDGAQRISRSTQVVVMMNGEDKVVSVMPDYQGPMQTFVVVLPVPADVQLKDVKTLKRADVERLEQLTAPRFHEFWEKDPCEPGKTEQIWERSMVASSDTDFLGGSQMFQGSTKVPQEMKLKVTPTFREDTEYKYQLVESDIAGWLSGKGYKLPSGAESKVSDYTSRGMKWLTAEVDPRLVELGPSGDALLSPIRYATKEQVSVLSTLGLAHLAGNQELLVYVLHPKDRFEVANYKNIYPPTNIRVDFKVKERMGEYYAALHDRILTKEKTAFLSEYAWPSTGCGQPCPNAAVHLHELLTLGGDYFEAQLDEETRNPEPPERTEEEEEFYKKAEKEERERLDYVRTETVRRKGLVERQGEYILTRLHHRYDKQGLPKDVELKSAGAVAGGVDIPQGKDGVTPLDVKSAAENTLQTRYYSLHPNKKVLECESPERYRWGKPPRTYRGARKIWVADRLASRNRKQINPEEMSITPIPALGIKGAAAAEAEAKAPAQPEEGKSKCDCRVPGGTPTRSGWRAGLWLVLALVGVRRWRRHPIPL